MTVITGAAAIKMADSIDEAIGHPPMEEDAFGDQMAALCESLARRIAFTLKQTGSVSPHASILSASQIAAVSIAGRAAELMNERTMQ